MLFFFKKSLSSIIHTHTEEQFQSCFLISSYIMITEVCLDITVVSVHLN